MRNSVLAAAEGVVVEGGSNGVRGGGKYRGVVTSGGFKEPRKRERWGRRKKWRRENGGRIEKKFQGCRKRVEAEWTQRRGLQEERKTVDRGNRP